MKKTKYYCIVGGGAFVLCGISLLMNVIKYINYNFSAIALIAVAAYFIIAFAMFTKRRDIILPICFSVFAVMSLFDCRGNMFIMIYGLLNLLASAGLAIICFGEFTDYVKGFYKPNIKKLWYMPALILFIVNFIIPILALKFFDYAMYISRTGIFKVLGYFCVGMWAVYPNGIVYNVISGKNAEIGVDVDTEHIINSIYECYCENVKRGLKAPATAVFCKSDELQITELEGVYTVSGWVDSQNSYGAMIRTPFKLKMKNENGKIICMTNVNILGSKQIVVKYLTYVLFGIVMAAILFGISYFVINEIF